MFRLHDGLKGIPVWKKVEEYANQRLSAKELDEYEIFLRPATTQEQAGFVESGTNMIVEFDPEPGYLELAIGVVTATKIRVEATEEVEFDFPTPRTMGYRDFVEVNVIETLLQYLRTPFEPLLQYRRSP